MSVASVVALDLGGTHVSAGLVDLPSLEIEAQVRRSLPATAGRAELLARITAAATEVSDGVPGRRVGMAVPGPFDYARGICLLSHKLEPLFGVDLRRELATALSTQPASVRFLNDADAFLLGEASVGAARGHARAVAVTLGTGLGSAFLEHGRIVDTGPRVPPEGSLHLVQFRGRPVEETISRAALLARYGDPRLDVREVASRARAGDPRAQRAFAELASALGEVTAPWLDSFEATCLVVGGAISRSWDLLAPPLRTALASVRRLEAIAPAARVSDAALLGAARHAARRD
jgi:glucokinase